jgi:hypothetical protein
VNVRGSDVAARIQRWHWGKLVILWAWGGLAAGVLMASFLSERVESNPLGSALSFVAGIAIAVALTIVTWLWLGGKEKGRDR